MEFQIKENKEKRRFEAQVKDSVAFVEYEMDNANMSLVHTEVPKELGGQGIGSKMIEKVLSKIKADGKKVKLLCPFIQKYVEKNPEWKDIVVD